MKECMNVVTLAGVLVKNGLEIKKVGEQDESIAGDIIIRTADGSEHEVNYFAYKYKKDKNDKTGKTFTGEENAMYKGYLTAINEYKALDKVAEGEKADIVKVGFSTIGVQDYPSKKDGNMTCYNDIKAKFINRVEEKDIETTQQTATFEIQGIVTKMQPEMKREQPTGNGEVYIDCIGYGGVITPIKLVVPEPIVEAFGNAGFYETGFAKFAGNILNTKTTETIVEKQGFGADIVKEVTTTLKRLEVTGGTPLGDVYMLATEGADPMQEYEAAKSRRRLLLEEKKNAAQNKAQGGQPKQGFTPAAPATTGTTPPPVNPFKANPFNKQA
jgi:hypothetical protein